MSNVFTYPLATLEARGHTFIDDPEKFQDHSITDLLHIFQAQIGSPVIRLAPEALQ